MKLTILDKVPDELYSIEVEDLHEFFGGPVLLHLKEGEGEAIFVSTLLHGNEHSGFLAIQSILKSIRSGQVKLKRPMMILIGNTIAAQRNLRHLEGQNDFNRVWDGGDCDLARAVNDLLYYVQDHDIYCSVDLHNNTGKNPFYSCVNKLDDKFLKLANHFCSHIVYFIEPSEVQSMAFSKICPSVTIEAGQSREVEGIEIIKDKLIDLMSRDVFVDDLDSSSLNIYETVARIKFESLTSMDFHYNSESKCDFSFLEDVDELNFKYLKPGVSLGYASDLEQIKVLDNDDKDITNEFFQIQDGKLTVVKEFIPAMLTKNQTVIFDDCFGYVMCPRHHA